ncbi:hypothetical protein VPH49_25385 [Pseudomonas luteola]|uniref:hypothetical protein n=1 Tax=Pseudomonas luteola TaxID=47886 RepID=UPI003A8472F6
MTDENQLRQLIKEELDSMYVPLRAQLQEIRDLLTETRRLQRQQIESELDGVHAPLTSDRKRSPGVDAMARGDDANAGKPSSIHISAGTRLSLRKQTTE